MFNKQKQKNTVLYWRQFSGNKLASFCSLKREIKICVLAVSTLAVAHHDCLACRADSLRVVEDAMNAGDLTLSEATVTGSQLPVSLDKTWSKIVVITRQEIDKAKCQTINDVLKLCPNVDVRQRGAMGVQTDISLGGGMFDQITFLLNGVNISNPHTGHLVADFPVAIADIERIEILDGASARTFGSQALNGIINIITRIEPDNNVALHAESGSYGTLGGGASVNLNTPSADLQHKKAHRASADFIRTDGAVANSAFHRVRAFYQGRYVADDLRLSWQAGYNTQRFGANTFYSALYPNQWEDGTRYTAALKADAKAGGLHLAPTLSFTRYYDHFQLIRHSAMGENFHRTDIMAASVSGYGHWALGQTALGGEVRHEGILSTNLGRPLDSAQFVGIEHKSGRYYDHRDTRTNVSLFLEHAVLLRHWSINIGAMVNRNSAVDDRFRIYPGVDISHRPTQSLRLFASYNKSMRMPTFTDLYYKSPTIEGNVGLKPEQSNTFKLGADYTHGSLSLSATGIYRRGSDMIDWVMYAPDDIYHSAAFKLSNYQLTAQAKIDLLHLMPRQRVMRAVSVSYFYNNQHRHDDTPIYQSNYALDYLRHKVLASLEHGIWSSLSATWFFRWQEREGMHLEYFGNDAVLRPNRPYALLDLKLRWTKPVYDLYASLENLFNHRYYDIGTIPQPGFTFLIGANYKFGIAKRK